jgi:pimeloyl-ACP methyl ester carboxylesterase
MVSFLANRQCTIAALVVLLILLMGLLPSPTPALAQSAVMLDSTVGPPATEVAVQGNRWLPEETAFMHFAIAGDAEIGEQKVIAGAADVSWQTAGPFQVTEPGRLRVIEALHMRSTNLLIGESISASFKIKNMGSSALHLEKLTAGVRRGSDWDGEQADFPHVSNITLQPNEEYSYQQSRSFDTAGEYFAHPLVKTNGQWGGIENASRVSFTVLTPKLREVVVFLEGLGSDLTQTEMDRIKESCYENSLFASIKLTLNNFECNDFLHYSYMGGFVDEKDVNREWHPYPYLCNQTGQSLTASIKQLRTMLGDYRREHTEIGEAVQFVLIGHDVGGVIALETTKFIGQDPGLPKGSIAAVVTIDSPLNHTSAKNLEDLRLIEQKLVLTKLASCGKRHIIVGESIAYPGLLLYSDVAKELADVTDANREHIREDKEKLVSAAQKNGVKFMTIGNDDDCLWFLEHCELARSWQYLNLSLPGKWIDDRSTMWIANADYKSSHPKNLYPLGKQGCDLSGSLGSLKFLCLADPHMIALDSAASVGVNIAEFIGEIVPAQ